MTADWMDKLFAENRRAFRAAQTNPIPVVSGMDYDFLEIGEVAARRINRELGIYVGHDRFRCPIGDGRWAEYSTAETALGTWEQLDKPSGWTPAPPAPLTETEAIARIQAAK